MDEAEVNLTPLLDIVFIMLIFFIVTATFVKEEGLDVNKPDAQTNQPPPDDEIRNIVLNIDSRGIIELEGREIDLRAVRPNVERLKAERPRATVVVRPEEDTETEVLVTVMDSARAATGENPTISPQN
jgi:biopolymer transport protein ExbD